MSMHISAPLTPPSQLRPGMPAELDRLLMAMLAKSPGERPSLADVRQRVAAIRAQIALAPAPAPAPSESEPEPRLDPDVKRRWWPWIGLVLAAAAATGFAVWRSSQDHDEGATEVVPPEPRAATPAASPAPRPAPPPATTAAEPTPAAAVTAAPPATPVAPSRAPRPAAARLPAHRSVVPTASPVEPAKVGPVDAGPRSHPRADDNDGVEDPFFPK
jgi:serine/threonine-protein kinase